MAAVLAGCITGAGYSSRDRLTDAARDYSSSVRWGKFDTAASHLPKEERVRFLDCLGRLEGELEIADYELVSVDVDAGRGRGTARVDYMWSLKRRGLVEKTSVEQVWTRTDGQWLLASETRVRGAPLPLFREPSGR
jgi:hypothetical protein